MRGFKDYLSLSCTLLPHKRDLYNYTPTVCYLCGVLFFFGWVF